MNRWSSGERRDERDANVDDFVVSDDKKIKWSSSLKQKLKRRQISEFSEAKIRWSLYRPFTKSNVYFDRMITERVYVFPSIFPTLETETENRVICVAGIGDRKGFGCLTANMIPSIDLAFEKNQCFPFYTYDEDGTNRRENITDWALDQFRSHYQDDAITKWDIFHYVYGLLHHPEYRERYQANLKRELPRIPFTSDTGSKSSTDFWKFAKAGQRLSEIHVGYEDVPEYPLTFIETPDVPLDWRVEKMRLSKDKTQIVYNDFLTLDGIPRKHWPIGSGIARHWNGSLINTASKKTNAAASSTTQTARTIRSTSSS